MKLVYFDDFKLGVLKGDAVVDVSAEVKDIPHTGPGDLMNGLIEHWGSYKPRLEAAVAGAAGGAVSGGRIRPPAPGPRTTPTHATDGDPVSYVFGYMNVIDGSARGLPPPGNVFFQMKSRDTFAPIGPYLVTKDEIADPQKLPIKLWVNGELKQDFNTDDMAHNIARCIEWASSIHTLEPGDILATGTNHRGLSSFMDGDVVELETQGLGKLRFNVRDEWKRTWLRATRLDRQEKGQEGPTPQVSGKYAK